MVAIYSLVQIRRGELVTFPRMREDQDGYLSS
jgi:hypothetical protein